MSNYNFYPGQALVCIDDGPASHGAMRPPLEKGRQYVAAEFNTCKCGLHAVDVGLRMNGLCDSVCPCGYEFHTPGIWWVGVWRFRPLDKFSEQVARIEKEGSPVEVETVEA